MTRSSPAVLAALVGCHGVAPAPREAVEARVAPPDEFVAAPEFAAGAVADRWLATFGDATLMALVDEAVARNPLLTEAAAVREQAAAAVGAARAVLLPRLAGLANLEKDEESSDWEQVVTLELGVSWEIDLWGRWRNAARAAEDDAAAADFEYEFLRQSLAALVAKAWFTAIVAREQVGIDRERLDSQFTTAEATARRAEAGVGTPLEFDFSEANVATAREQLAASEFALAEAVRALELLLGRYPGAELEVSASLPELPPMPRLGIPADLLERRPDLIAAERRVAAAFFRAESARLARLPRVSIEATSGWALNPAAGVWSLVADVFAPLFAGGEITSQIEMADAGQRAALAAYIERALTAFAEVEGSLAAARALDRRWAELQVAVARLESANRIAQDRYEAGVLTIFELNQLRQGYFDARSRCLTVQLERLRRRIDLHLALGGAFDEGPLRAEEPGTPTAPAAGGGERPGGEG